MQDNNVLFARLIQQINEGLKNNISWLNECYGEAQTIVKNINEQRYVLPCVYIGNGQTFRPNDYIEVTPDKHKGNFSFFLLDDPQDIDWTPNQQGYVSTPFSIIFWFDLRTIFGQNDVRNIDSVKAQILRELNGGFSIKGGRIEINRIYQQATNVYRGFTIDEIGNQFYMHPYGGLRFEGTMTTLEPCYM